MRNYLQFGLIALLSNHMVLAAGTPEDGWYAGGELLASYVPSINFTLTNAQFNILNASLINAPIVLGGPFPPIPFGTPGRQTYQVGGGVAGQAGYRWCGFRLEGELLFNYNSLKQLTIGGYEFNKKIVSTNALVPGALPIITFPYNQSGHARLFSALFNFYYDFYNHEYDDVTWYPYLGLGVGYANVQHQWVININVPTVTGFTQTPILNLTESESSPVGQAIIGIGYQMDDFFSVYVDYRFLASKQLKTTNDRLAFHTINFGFNYWFNA